MDEVLLHPGNNAGQEFYEAEDGSWLVFCNHGCSTWTVYRDAAGPKDANEKQPGSPKHHCLDAPSLEGALKEVRLRFGVVLCVDEGWRFDGRGDSGLVQQELVPA